MNKSKQDYLLSPNKSRNSAAVAIDNVSLDLFPPGDTSATLTNLKTKELLPFE